jgi:multiple sugar transport system substrate-binding protein
MKRSIIILAAALAIASMLAACGGSGGSSSGGSSATTSRGPITIWYSNNPQEVAWGKQVVAAWNAAHADQKVTGQEIPAGSSSEAVISAAITAGTTPALIYNTSPASVPDFQKMGGLVNLSAFPDGASYIESRTGAAAAQYKSADGNYYQLPWKSNPVMIFYNKAIMQKAGINPNNPPLATYAQFLSTARAIVESKAAKYAIYPSPASEFFQSWYDFYAFYAAESGGKQLVANGASTFADAAGISVEQLWRTIYAGKLAGNEPYTGDSFADGTAAMELAGPWAIATYGKMAWGVAPIPTSGGMKPTAIYTFSDAKNVAMYTSCKNQATAWDFLKFSTSPEQDKALLETTGQMPLRANLTKVYPAFFAAHPPYKLFATQADRLVEVPNVSNSIQAWQTFRDAWTSAVIFGKGDVSASLTKAAADINKLVSQK